MDNITNYERIKNMSVEEMAKFMFWVKNRGCVEGRFCSECQDCICYEDDEICLCGIEKWLNSEVDDG